MTCWCCFVLWLEGGGAVLLSAVVAVWVVREMRRVGYVLPVRDTGLHRPGDRIIVGSAGPRAERHKIVRREGPYLIARAEWPWERLWYRLRPSRTWRGNE